MKLEIKKGEPWVMWPDLLVGNFNDFPANKIFDHKGDYVFTIEFELVEQLTDKVCLFSKLPSYFGVDLRNGGITLTYSEKDKETDYIDANYNWLVGKRYELKIEKKDKNIILTIDKFQIFNFKIENDLKEDSDSHIIFGAGNFPKNGFNLNYFNVILYSIKIVKDGEVISHNDFEKFIHGKSYDITGNCNFIHKII